MIRISKSRPMRCARTVLALCVIAMQLAPGVAIASHEMPALTVSPIAPYTQAGCTMSQSAAAAPVMTCCVDDTSSCCCCPTIPIAASPSDTADGTDTAIACQSCAPGATVSNLTPLKAIAPRGAVTIDFCQTAPENNRTSPGRMNVPARAKESPSYRATSALFITLCSFRL